MILKQDCTHFPGDRPCSFHKQTGVICTDCKHYEPAGFGILIIKLDAAGDVLRTTSILPGLREKYPHAHITWVTLENSIEIFDNNPLVDKILSYESTESIAHLAVEKFSLLVNLDTSSQSAALASYCHADEKLGFGLDTKGKVFCFNKEAETWFEMGAFDHLKKRNTRTYQSLMLEICRLQPRDFEIILNLTVDELARAKDFSQSHGMDLSRPVIGMNTGAGPRWQQKKWTLEGYRELIVKIVNETNYTVILYGGKHERERNAELSGIDRKRVIAADTEGSLRDFFSLLSLSDVVITGDTLALHAATALKKRVIAIFGPTSVSEIETYGRVRKVQSETVECRCFYRPVCTQDVNCMNTIPAERIYNLLQDEVGKIAPDKKASAHTDVRPH